jgi:hypothetical protein
MTACDMEQSRIPPFAVHKISQVIDDLCGDILQGQGELMQDWETVRVSKSLRNMETFETE